MTILHVGVIQAIRVVLDFPVVPTRSIGKPRLVEPFRRVDGSAFLKFIGPHQLIKNTWFNFNTYGAIVEEIIQVGHHPVVVVFSIHLKDHPIEVGSGDRGRLKVGSY